VGGYKGGSEAVRLSEEVKSSTGHRGPPTMMASAGSSRCGQKKTWGQRHSAGAEAETAVTTLEVGRDGLLTT